MRPALRAEWTKLRTVSGPWWLLLALIATTVCLSSVVMSVAECADQGCGDPTRLSLVGVQLGQAPAAVLGVLVIGGDYGSGLIRTTLVATPCRVRVLAAKAITVAGVVGVAGTLSVLGSLLAGHLMLPRHGFSATPGHPILSPPDGATLRAATGSVLYLVLIALLGLGVTTAVRDAASSTGVVLGLLYLLPVLTQAIGDPGWQSRIERLGPMSAGLAVQSTTNLDRLPIGPWAGLGVTAAWAAAGLAAGGLLLQRRDA
jgi:ABC-2 type transport system permease protein